MSGIRMKDNLPWVCEESLVEMEQELARGIARVGATVPMCLIGEIRRLQAENRRLRKERERLFQWTVDNEQLIAADYNRNYFLPKDEAIGRSMDAMKTGDQGCREVLDALAEHDAQAVSD